MTKDRLITVGINYDEGVHRFAGNERLYEKYLVKFFNLNQIAELKAAIDSGNNDEAFKIAHNLKSSCGNMSISTLYDTICDMVETLRGKGGDISRLNEMCARACAIYDEAKRVVLEDEVSLS